MNEAPGRRDDAVRTPRKRQAETEVFIGTPPGKVSDFEGEADEQSS